MAYRPRELLADLLDALGALLFLASTQVRKLPVLAFLVCVAWAIYYLWTRDSEVETRSVAIAKPVS